MPSSLRSITENGSDVGQAVWFGGGVPPAARVTRKQGRVSIWGCSLTGARWRNRDAATCRRKKVGNAGLVGTGRSTVVYSRAVPWMFFHAVLFFSLSLSKFEES